MKQLLEKWIKLLGTSGVNSKKLVLDEMIETLNDIKEDKHTTVKDILHACDSSVKVAIVDAPNDKYIEPPNSVGFILTMEHWSIDSKVTEINIKDNVLVLSVEVE